MRIPPLRSIFHQVCGSVSGAPAREAGEAGANPAHLTTARGDEVVESALCRREVSRCESDHERQFSSRCRLAAMAAGLHPASTGVRVPPPRPFSFQSRLTSRPASCYLVSVKVRILPLEPWGIGVTGARRSLKPQAKGRHLHPQPFFSSARQPETSPARHAGIARSITEADDHKSIILTKQ